MAGVSVSLDRSDDKTVEIPRISLDTAGTYMCEVGSFWAHIGTHYFTVHIILT